MVITVFVELNKTMCIH